MTALSRCWRNSSTCLSRVRTRPHCAWRIAGRASTRLCREVIFQRLWSSPQPGCREPQVSRGRQHVSASHAGEDDFAVLDLDEVDARIALAAFLARGAGFLELVFS